MILDWNTSQFGPESNSAVFIFAAVWAAGDSAPVVPIDARVSQVVLEYLTRDPSITRVTQCCIEIIIRRGVLPPPPEPGCVVSLPIGAASDTPGCVPEL
jgi:hypothetical protein